MAALSPKEGAKLQATTFETQKRLEKCWKVDVNWTYYPDILCQVRELLYAEYPPISRSTFMRALHFYFM